MFVCALVLTVGLAAVMGILYSNFDGQMRKELSKEAAYLAYGVEQQGTDYLKNVKDKSSRITYINKDGTVLFDNKADADEMQNHKNRTEFQKAEKYGAPDFITTLSKDRSFYQVMDECYHIRPNHSVLEIDGKAAQSHSADTLKCNVGDPLFSIHKISYDQDGKPIHYSLTTVRCDRVTYVVSTNDSTVMDEKIKSN